MDKSTRKRLGGIIASLREQTINPDTMRPYTQAELAETANLSLKTLRNLEQGKKANVQASTLTQIANALRLTLLEREVLSRIPTQIDRANVVRTQKAPKIMLSELENELRDTLYPAVLYDPFYHLVTATKTGLVMHGLEQALLDGWTKTYGSIHMLLLVFHPDSPLRHILSDIWERYAILHVHQFRAMVLRYRHTPYFQQLFEQLCRLDDFLRLWTATQWQEGDFDTALKPYGCYKHPQHGELCYCATMTERITPSGRLYLSTLLPKSASTAEAFDQLHGEHGLGIQRVTPWPHSALCPDAESMYSE